MDTLTLNYIYYGHQIKQTLSIDDLVDMINQLNAAQRIRIKIKLMQNILCDDILQPFQIAVLKKQAEPVLKMLEWVKE